MSTSAKRTFFSAIIVQWLVGVLFAHVDPQSGARVIPGELGPTTTKLARGTDLECSGAVLELTGKNVTDAVLQEWIANTKNTENSPVVLKLSYSNITDNGL